MQIAGSTWYNTKVIVDAFGKAGKTALEETVTSACRWSSIFSMIILGLLSALRSALGNRKVPLFKELLV